jgi:hypothetical protein
MNPAPDKGMPVLPQLGCSDVCERMARRFSVTVTFVSWQGLPDGAILNPVTTNPALDFGRSTGPACLPKRASG